MAMRMLSNMMVTVTTKTMISGTATLGKRLSEYSSKSKSPNMAKNIDLRRVVKAEMPSSSKITYKDWSWMARQMKRRNGD